MQYTTVIMTLVCCLQIIYAENETCTWHGLTYQAGESVTGNPCDQCTCTQFGVMCALIHCPRTMCIDEYIPEGECCPICPNGNNCLYINNGLKAVVPEMGCRLNRYQQCYCHETSNIFFDRPLLQPYCLPALPFFRLPLCKTARV